MHRTMLAASPVPAAVAGNAIAASLVTELANAGHITAQFTFDYGSGGTSATYWLQTSLDGGATWIDIACVQFTTADAVKIVNIDAGGYVAPGYVPGDGTLAVGSVVDGIMGDRLRVKQTIVGSYANSTISVDVVDKAGVGGPKTVTQAGAPAALGQAAASASMPVVEAKSTTATTSSVNDTASNVTILAANANRLGATVYNDSTSILYLKLGATATTTDYTVKLLPDDYYEIPAKYAGIIDGIWSADASGAARVTELV